MLRDHCDACGQLIDGRHFTGTLTGLRDSNGGRHGNLHDLEKTFVLCAVHGLQLKTLLFALEAEAA